VLIGVTGAAAVVLVAASLARRPPRTPWPRSRREAAGGTTPELEAPVAVLDDIGRELRAGASLVAATTSALARRPGVLPDVHRALARGAPLSAALARAAGPGTDELVLLQALRASVAAGGPSSLALERAAMVLRERSAWRAERRAQSAQARLSATLLTLVPLAVAAWAAASSSRVRAAYLTMPVTWFATAAGVACNVLGWWWMRRAVGGGR